MVIECDLKVHVRTEFDDDVSDAETVRYQLEQDLEDLGYDADVEIINNDLTTL